MKPYILLLASILLLQITSNQCQQKIKSCDNDRLFAAILSNFRANEDAQVVLITLFSTPEHANCSSVIGRMLYRLIDDQEEFVEYGLVLYNENKKVIGSALQNAVVQEDNGRIRISLKNQLQSTAKLVINTAAFATSMKSLDGFLTALETTSMKVNLVATSLTMDVGLAIMRYYKGEIDGHRASKIVIDSLIKTSAIHASAATCAAAGGAAFGAPGALASGALCSVVGSLVGDIVSQRITKIFDLHPDEAVDKAYKFFGCTVSSSVKELNEAYRAMALKHHPDKGGDEKKFYEINTMFELIRADRDG